MKTKTLMFFAWAVASLTALAQTNQPAVEDFKPATTNQRGKEYVSPETAHEWLTWRRCLREFAPLLFKN
jgi:hypothetical protein